MTALVEESRNQISEIWSKKEHVWSSLPNRGFDSEDQYLAFCAAKDWLQDTSEALSVHRGRGFSQDPFAAYVEFWGVLQAAFVQQDAIDELYFALTGTVKIPKKLKGPAWWKIRDTRNLLVGHPTRKGGEQGEPLFRSVSGRQPKTYSAIPVAVYSRSEVSYRAIDLGSLLDDYDQEAGAILHDILNMLSDRLEA